MTDTIICWFRQDLRLSDNPAFLQATKRGEVLPIFILDDVNAEDHRMGSASRWWLHHSLYSLQEKLNGNLRFYQGDAKLIIENLLARKNVCGIYWNRCYEPWRIRRDTAIKSRLEKENIEHRSFNASLLWEPWQNLKSDGTPYKVFTPYYKNALNNLAPPREALEPREKIRFARDDFDDIPLEALALLPDIRWDKQLEPHWQIGETGAETRLDEFIDQGLTEYKTGRDFPASESVSRLSPHIHWGEISPFQLWHAIERNGSNDQTMHFQRELVWREFSHSLLFHFPDLSRDNLQKKFDAFPWTKNSEHLFAWQKGLTGYPIVDAGMRELWQTGYMHNRVRMIVGSFLVKNLLIHWHCGEEWFWDCLLDADLANNSASWQWIAGCGADAAPFFRIFNPVTQGEKFDSRGIYTRRFVPELAQLPDKYLFSPWTAPEEVLLEANIK